MREISSAITRRTFHPTARSVVSFGIRLVDSIVDYPDYLVDAESRIPQETRADLFVRDFYLDRILEYLDLLYYDIKHMDDAVHKEFTGVSNILILDYAQKASIKCPTVSRIPVVPGCNDSEENIWATARFAAGLGENLLRIELIPYHKYGIPNKARLGKEYQLQDVDPPSEEHI